MRGALAPLRRKIMTGHIARVTIQQIDALRAAGLEVRINVCVYRILTKTPAGVEILHQIVKDPDHSPDFINGNFRIYLAMLTGE